MSRTVSVLFLVCTVATPNSRAEEDPVLSGALALQRRFHQLVEKVEPSLVCIHVSRSDDYQRFGAASPRQAPGKLGGYDRTSVKDFLTKAGVARKKQEQIIQKLDLADPDNVPEDFGTGVIIDRLGLILTCYHVVEDARKIYVRIGERGGSYANIHAADPRSDLAVLKLINSNHRLEPVPLGKASAIQRGSCIMAMTFPFTGGFRDGQASVARGLISNIRRWIPRKRNAKLLRPAEVLLQTDIRLGIGGSGGPIIDLHGNFVALTTARGGLSSQAVPGGFAIPMTSGNRAVIAKLKRGEEVEYGFLGISFLPSARKTNGVRITYVTPGSPADKAGLVAKNAILEVNSAPVTHSDELLVTLSRLFADQPVRLTVQKADTAKRQILTVKLAKAFPVGKVIATTVKRPFFRGLRVDHTSTLVRPDRSDLPYNKIPDGVLVTEVQPGTPAGKVLRGTGDVILAVNGHKVRNPTEFYHAVEKARGVIGLTVMPTNPREEPPTLQLPAE